MLRVSLHQFRCWESLTIEIPLNGVTLIKGNSGAGKTTILQAIVWCLYGNIRLVAPNHIDKAKTRVIVELPYSLNGTSDILTINRQKNPGRLVLTHGTNSYEDKVAQSLIDDLFGTYDIWLASCYIGQGCRNSFLTAPNTGKMEFLNNIAFHEEDPTTYIERIDAAITEADLEYKNKLAIFTNNLNSFQTLLSTTDTTKALTPEQIATTTRQIESLTQEQASLNAIKTQRDIQIAVLTNVQKQLTQANNTVITIPKADDTLTALNHQYGTLSCDTCIEVEACVKRVMDIIPMLQRRDDLVVETKKYEYQLVPYVNHDPSLHYTPDDYRNTVSRETTIRDTQRTVQNLGLLYSESHIRDTIQHHRNTLSSQERLKLEQQRDMLQNRITTLEHIKPMPPLQFPEIIPQNIAMPDYSRYDTTTLSEELTELSKKHGAISAHIQHIQRGHDVIQCPQCKSSLRHQHNTLILADTEPVNLDELAAAKQQLSVIDASIVRTRQSIQSLKNDESRMRTSYETSIVEEQKRLNNLRERIKQLEFEQQRRDIAEQDRIKQIQDYRHQLEKLSESILLIPEVIGSYKVLTAIEIDQTHALIARLSNIHIISSPSVPSQQIESYLKYHDLLQQQATAIRTHQEYIETIPIAFRSESVRNVQVYLEKLRSYWSRIRESSEEQIRLNRLKISFEEQIRAITNQIGFDPQSEIELITTQIAQLQQNLVLSTAAHQAIQYHAQITREREEVVNLNTALSDLGTFRQYAVETECRILQQIVDSINVSIQSVCTSLFDRDISIALSLFKTLKTTKNVKPVVNFAISYQGGSFDNISQMSGGEGDRASLALTLALKRLSSCPLLMLDESLASLDLNMKEASIRTIRENLNETVLIVMHDGIEGVFQNVIDLDDIATGRY
jgi:DNA repair exonuclease SbcCD ATPase subunit